MKNLLLATLAIALSASLAVASMGAQYAVSAADFHQRSVYWVDDHQDITVDFRLNADGTGHFHSRYSNGKRLDGDHFYARVVMTDERGGIVAEAIAGVGLNATYGGGTNVAFRDLPFELPPEHRARIANVRFEVGHSDAVDDGAFWQSIAQVATMIFGDASAGIAIFSGNAGGTDLTPILIQ